MKPGTNDVAITVSKGNILIEMYSTTLDIPNEPGTNKLGSREYMGSDDGTLSIEQSRALYQAIETLFGSLDE